MTSARAGGTSGRGDSKVRWALASPRRGLEAPFYGTPSSLPWRICWAPDLWSTYTRCLMMDCPRCRANFEFEFLLGHSEWLKDKAGVLEQILLGYLASQSPKGSCRVA